jgi:membrane protein CcdC involved in cytochrome C biogenesis
MLLMRAVGLLVLVAGLILVGISGDNHRPANGRNIAFGASLMAAGALVAFFAAGCTQIIAWLWL